MKKIIKMVLGKGDRNGCWRFSLLCIEQKFKDKYDTERQVVKLPVFQACKTWQVSEFCIIETY